MHELVPTSLSYSLSSWSRVLPQKLTGSQLITKFPAFYGTRRFITAFTSALHLSLSWARSVHAPPHSTSWRSIVILSSHLRLGLPSRSLSLRFPHQNCVYICPVHHTCYMSRISLSSRTCSIDVCHDITLNVPVSTRNVSSSGNKTKVMPHTTKLVAFVHGWRGVKESNCYCIVSW